MNILTQISANSSRHLAALLFLLLPALFGTTGAFGQAEERGDDKSKGKPPGDEKGESSHFKGKNGGPPHGKDLFSKEEMERVRAVMGEVWQDEEVTKARDEVHRATEAYREALKNAVSRVDPEVVALMDKMHEDSRSMAFQRKRPGFGPSMGRTMNPEELIERFLGAEPAFRAQDEPRRAELLGMARKLAKSGALDAQTGILLKPDQVKEHGPARAELRKLMVEKLSAEADWVREAFENSPPPVAPKDRYPRPGAGPDGEPKPKRPETE